MTAGNEALAALGWNSRLQSATGDGLTDGSEPARVVWSGRGLYRIRSAAGESEARLAGSLDYKLSGPGERPVVGDWVLTEASTGTGSMRVITRLIERLNSVSRKRAGRESSEQVLAANVDTGCIVFSLEGGRNCTPRSAERYATMAWSSGIIPLILLNKIDIAADAERSLREIESVTPGVDVLPISCRTHAGIDEVRKRIGSGRTAVLLGPSGVGKSSLVNVLADAPVRTVGEMRTGDRKGRHTTTDRQLIILPGGGMMIDSPGLRELQPWADESDLADSFPEIAELAQECRFRDCTHSGEPGCAVQAALSEGAIPYDRFESFLELNSELDYQRRRSDERLRREDRKRERQLSLILRDFQKRRREEREDRGGH